MNYIQLNIHSGNSDLNDVLIAELAALQFEGFEELEDGIKAFITEPEFNAETVKQLLSGYGVSQYSTGTIEPQNWNAQWESNFSPVVIKDVCTIYAPFHNIEITTPYSIKLTPKMSFGTGHHGTTQSMVELMSEVDFKGKSVLDFGTGTGVLAILADKLGAAHVEAIDNDSWSFENAGENIVVNDAKNVTVQLGTIEDIDPSRKFDVILANINRHILLATMHTMSEALVSGGILLMSGILIEDEAIITKEANKHNLTVMKVVTNGNWVAIKACKYK